MQNNVKTQQKHMYSLYIGSLIQNWADENGLNFSKTKTACVHFCTKRKPHNDPCLHLDGNQIKVLKEVKFLGIIYDYKLFYVLHIKMLKEKCKNKIIKIVANSTWGADKITLLLSNPSWITVELFMD